MNRSFLQPKWKHTGLLSQRFEKIEPYIRGKRVLDVGCVVGYTGPNWMHSMMKSKAAAIKGIDINCEAVKILQNKGFDVVCQDAQNFNLDATFEVIHAGELIEHLDNFHGFLSCCRTHLDTQGLLVITTPNAMRIGNFVYSAMGGLEVNNEHTCWFCDKTLSTLLERNGFQVCEMTYLKHETRGIVRRALSSSLRMFLSERNAWNTIMAVAKVR